MKAIDGLQSLETLDGVLTITQNAELTSLEGLKNLTKVTEELEISRNPKLPQCEIDELLSHVDAGEVNFKLNGSEAEPCDKNGT